MYQQYTEPFGKFTRHVLTNPGSGNRMDIVPGKGGCLLALQLGNRAVIAGFESPEALDQNSGARSMPLFPFPNRLRGGTYDWEGQTYQFPKTDKAGPNAIHGLGRHVVMHITREKAERSQATLECTYDHTGEHPGYPFPFHFTMSYHLDDETGFRLEMVFSNRHDQAVPVGFGWHPYFQIGGPVNSAFLQLPSCEHVEVDEYKIPTGRRSSFDTFRAPRPIGDLELDDCLALTYAENPTEVLLQGENGRLRYWQETGPGKFNFLQVYTPADRKSIAIEPMTCNIDAFHNRQGLLILGPGQTARAACGVSLIH